MTSIIQSFTSHQKLLSLCLITLLLMMCVSISTAVVEADFWTEVNRITAMQWGKVTVMDLYIGLLLFSGWVYWRENNIRRGLLWSVLILLLGNLMSCLYLLLALHECSDEPAQIMQRKGR